MNDSKILKLYSIIMKEYLTRRLDDGHTWYYLCDTIINVFLLLIVKAVHHSKEFMMKLKLRNKFDNPYFMSHQIMIITTTKFYIIDSLLTKSAKELTFME